MTSINSVLPGICAAENSNYIIQHVDHLKIHMFQSLSLITDYGQYELITEHLKQISNRTNLTKVSKDNATVNFFIQVK